MLNKLNFDVFTVILSHLPLGDRLDFRLVSQDWKEAIDEHLRRQSVISILSEKKFQALSRMRLTLGLNLGNILRNQLPVSVANIKDVNFTSRLIKMFPNIREVYIMNTKKRDRPFNIDYVLMMTSWTKLRTLAVSYIPETLPTREFFDSVNKLKDLQRLIVLEEVYNTIKLEDHEPFLSRVTKLHLPSLLSVPDIDYSNIRGLAYDIDEHTEYSLLNLSSVKFPKMDSLRVFFWHYNMGGSREQDPKDLFVVQDLTCLLRVNRTIETIEFAVDPFFYEYAGINYEPFFMILNRFPCLKTIKFQMAHGLGKFFLCLGGFLSKFESIKTIYIDIPKDYKGFVTSALNNCIEALPLQSTGSVEKIVFQPMVEKHYDILLDLTYTFQYSYKIDISNEYVFRDELLKDAIIL